MQSIKKEVSIQQNSTLVIANVTGILRRMSAIILNLHANRRRVRLVFIVGCIFRLADIRSFGVAGVIESPSQTGRAGCLSDTIREEVCVEGIACLAHFKECLVNRILFILVLHADRPILKAEILQPFLVVCRV